MTPAAPKNIERLSPFARSILFLSLLVVACQQDTDPPPKVVTSIGPVYGITSFVMQGIDTPDLILRAATSHHTFSLKPSQARALAQAKLVIWIGPEMERPLAEPIAARGDRPVLTLGEVSGMSHLKQREGEGHHRVDPHIWLSPANAAAAAVAIAGALADLDPDNAVAYHQNKELFLEQLIDMEKDIEALLMPVRSNGFLVLHDSTQYFEKSFGLTTLAIAEPGHDLPAGAGQISSLIATINEKQPSCMVHDEGLGSKLPALLARETGIRIVIIDPLGREISWGQQTYFDLMWALAKQMEECLKEPSPS